jgi:hypothetical protein
MSTAAATSSRLTSSPSAPVCGETIRFDSMNFAASRISSTDLHSLTNPALPRPPAWTWALITTWVFPARSSSPALSAASSTVWTMKPAGTGTPALSSSSRAWYSCTFMKKPHMFR